MPLKFYKGRATGNGASCDIYFNSKDESCFITITKQSGYDNVKKLASFFNGDFARMKFNTTELGKFLRTIEKNKESSGFHGGYEGNKQQYFFKPYFDKENDTIQKGYSLSFIRHEGGEKLSFQIGFDMDEARVLKEYFIFILHHIFSAIYAADKKASIERSKKKEIVEKEPGSDPQEKVEAQPVEEPKPSVVDEDLF